MGRRVKVFWDSNPSQKRAQIYTTEQIRAKINLIVDLRSRLERRQLTRDEVLLDMIRLYVEAYNLKETAKEIMADSVIAILED